MVFTCMTRQVGQHEQTAKARRYISSLSVKYNFLGYHEDAQTCRVFHGQSCDQAAHRTADSSRGCSEPANISVRLRCFIHRLISPMHRTDVCIDASNFQPMNGIKQHLGESYRVTFVLM